MSEFFYLFHQPLGRNAGNGFFARRINGQNDQDIGIIKSARKIFFQSLRPRVSVRLKYGHDPAITGIAGGAERCDDFGRVMPIVIHDQNVCLSFPLT